MLLEIVSRILQQIGSRLRTRIEAMYSVRDAAHHDSTENLCNLSDFEIRLIHQLSATWHALAQQAYVVRLYNKSGDVSDLAPSAEHGHNTDGNNNNHWNGPIARINQLCGGRILRKLLPPDEVYSLVLIFHEIFASGKSTQNRDSVDALGGGDIWGIPHTTEREFQHGDNLTMATVLRKISQFTESNRCALTTSITLHIMHTLKIYLVSDPLKFDRDVVEAFFAIETLHNLSESRTPLTNTGGYLLDVILCLATNHRQWSQALLHSMNIGEEMPHIIDHWWSSVFFTPASPAFPTITEKRLVVFTDRAFHFLNQDAQISCSIAFESISSAQVGCGGKRWVIEFTGSNGAKMRAVFGFYGNCNSASLLDWIGTRKKGPGNIRRSVVSTYTLLGSCGVDELVWTALTRLIGSETIQFLTFVRKTPHTTEDGQTENLKNTCDDDLILALTNKRLLLLREDVGLYHDPIGALLGNAQNGNTSTQSLLQLLESHEIANITVPSKPIVSSNLRISVSDSTTLDLDFHKPDTIAFFAHLLCPTA